MPDIRIEDLAVTSQEKNIADAANDNGFFFFYRSKIPRPVATPDYLHFLSISVRERGVVAGVPWAQL
tara:strand:- start:1019 stop:1219 length:201 start_codon:yes stop_codon:yes gene_type:complete